MRALFAPTTILLALVIAPPAAVAQSLDGAYGGTITCASMPGTTRLPLRGSLKLVVTGATATYEREIQSTTGQPTGQFERGSGSVSTAGAITLSGSGHSAGASVSASYSGTISGGVARLTGVQNWTLARGAPDPGGGRKCDIEAKATR